VIKTQNISMPQPLKKGCKIKNKNLLKNASELGTETQQD